MVLLGARSATRGVEKVEKMSRHELPKATANGAGDESRTCESSTTREGIMYRKRFARRVAKNVAVAGCGALVAIAGMTFMNRIERTPGAYEAHARQALDDAFTWVETAVTGTSLTDKVEATSPKLPTPAARARTDAPTQVTDRADAGMSLTGKPETRSTKPPAPAAGARTHAPTQITGRVDVIDGDTLAIDGRRVRLLGIDAPEAKQTCLAEGARWPCGKAATEALIERTTGRAVTCTEHDQDRYGRAIAVCRAGGEDLNARMVSEGLAIAYRRYSKAYVEHEQSARSAGCGLWRGDFVPPYKWRTGERLATTPSPGSNRPATGASTERRPRTRPQTRRDAATGPTEECRIKGNISRDGTRIYHVPGGRYYNQTRINTSRGERCFRSEREARREGWRRSKR